MDWTAQERERNKAIAEERRRLLAMDDVEAESLPVPERYQRMRYQREIFANQWAEEQKRGLPPVESRPMKSRYYGKKSRVDYPHD
jgi:hypothetical protein